MRRPRAVTGIAAIGTATVAGGVHVGLGTSATAATALPAETNAARGARG